MRIPSTGPDESLFAQASRQMLATGDVVRIMFQDEPRHKKPAGIYWLQAAAAAAIAMRDSLEIWPYRLPSVPGAVVAVLLTLDLGRHLFDHATALLGAGLLAPPPLLIAEAHIASADAAVFAASATSLWVLRFCRSHD
jgi:4-amino-4-deoxy-L-arabinose transferase-like glycosyltransferase